MPRPRTHHGRPNTRVLPKGWAERHRPVLEDTRTGRISLRTPGSTTGPVDPNTGRRPVISSAPYAVDVPCRVQVLPAAGRRGQIDAADQQITVVGYQITVPLTHDDTPLLVKPGHLGRLTRTGDPLLDGRDVNVDDVTRGSLLLERVLLCTLTT